MILSLAYENVSTFRSLFLSLFMVHMTTMLLRFD